MSHLAPFHRSVRGRARRSRAIHRRADQGRSLDRPLRLEALEDRRLLAGVVVGNNLDVVNGNTTTIALLIANDGGDGISLREAILAANATAGADEVTFAAALSGQTITLGGTELAISEALTIDARPLAANVTINANQLSRIFNITATTGDFILGGLTLTRGRTTSNSMGGGAIRSDSNDGLSIDQCTVSGNSTTGGFSDGGGIFAQGFVKLTQSIFSGNSTTGNAAGGGAIHVDGGMLIVQSIISGNSTLLGSAAGGGIHADGDVMLIQSTVAGNSTTGNTSKGAGIHAFGAVTLTQSTISGNSTAGTFSWGAGMYAVGDIMLNQSTVSGNSTTGDFSHGGGIYTTENVTLNQSTVSGNSTAGMGAFSGGIEAQDNVTISQSTVSGNSTAGSGANGGGIRNRGAVTLTQSTVTNNRAMHATAMGGGVFQYDRSDNFPFSISDSIVAGNTAGGGGPDLVKDPQSTLTVNFSVIGTGVMPTAGTGNVATNNPQLAPLTNNGGPTQTHATLAASPAINAGDPSIAFDPAESDQRGGPFVRVFGGRIDAGAYERQTVSGLSLVVDTTDDLYDGNFGEGSLSLREAIGLANGMFGADAVTFAEALTGATIALSGTDIEISETLTIDARPLAVNVTVDAQQLSRIFNITATTGDFTLGGLTLTRGKTPTLLLGGGAIRSLTTGSLTIVQSTVSGNSTTGGLGSSPGAPGGGIYARGSVMLTQSTVSGNSTVGYFCPGGGIYAKGNVTLTQSTVSGNSTAKIFSNGGGIFTFPGNLTLIQSTVNGNSAGPQAKGGGIFAQGDVTLIQSTVSGNTVSGSGGRGGGIAAARNLTLTQSTVSGNVEGVFKYAGYSATVTGSILTGNGTDFGYLTPFTTFLTANYSLIGTQVTPNSGANNVVSDNPMLGPLAFNGGLTQTRALLAGSPAIDAGDPAIVFNPAESDQRGAPFLRVVDGDPFVGARIDIGAFELQPPPAPSADFDADGDRDGADFLAWQRGLGSAGSGGAHANGDADFDQDVDGVDLGFWKTQFGTPPPTLGESLRDSQSAADAVFAAGDFTQLFATSANDDRDPIRSYRPRRRR